MKTIDELWKKLKDVELVQVRPVEMEAMYKHCFEFDKCKVIEIGSAHGASSIIFAEAVKELGGLLICIDSYPEDYYGQDKFGEYAHEAFRKNVLGKYSLETVILFNNTSDEVAERFEENNVTDILFVDGDHSYEGVKKDCQNYLRLLKPGGYVGFHDYNNVAFGVKQAADEFTQGWEKESIWDLAIFKKP